MHNYYILAHLFAKPSELIKKKKCKCKYQFFPKYIKFYLKIEKLVINFNSSSSTLHFVSKIITHLIYLQ